MKSISGEWSLPLVERCLSRHGNFTHFLRVSVFRGGKYDHDESISHFSSAKQSARAKKGQHHQCLHSHLVRWLTSVLLSRTSVIVHYRNHWSPPRRNRNEKTFRTDNDTSPLPHAHTFTHIVSVWFHLSLNIQLTLVFSYVIIERTLRSSLSLSLSLSACM